MHVSEVNVKRLCGRIKEHYTCITTPIFHYFKTAAAQPGLTQSAAGDETNS